MSSEKQIEANRQNAQKSTGPKTPEGKEKVSQNAITHGLFAQQPVLDVEDPARYARLRDDFFGRFTPRAITKSILPTGPSTPSGVSNVPKDMRTSLTNNLVARAGQEIMEQHGLTLETMYSSFSPEDCLAAALERDFAKDHTLRRIQQYELCIDRTCRNSLKELHKLQSQRLNQTSSNSGGTFKDVGSHSDQHPCGCSDSAISQNKPNIHNTDSKTKVQLDPKLVELANRLYDEGRTNPFGMDLIAKMESKNLRDRQTAKIAC